MTMTMLDLGDTRTRPFVLIPLYIYPSEAAWEPLLEAARAYREVQFVAVINPDSGPGATRLPDGSYTAALRRLTALPNIRTLGYVHCRYGARPADAVRADIDVYGGWRGPLAVNGVFFDETPADAHLAGYMAALAAHTKATWAAGALVVFNPGVVVPPVFFRSADYVVVFEASEAQWNSRCLADVAAALQPVDEHTRAKAVAIMHSSSTLAAARVEGLLRELRSLGLTGLYVTDQQDGGYTRWPTAWMQFAEAVAACK